MTLASGSAHGVGRLLTESGGYAAIEVAQQGIALVTVAALLPWITPEEFGRLTLALVVGQVGTTLATLGLEFTVLRQYLGWPAHRRPGAVSGALAVSTAWATVLAVAGWWGCGWFDAGLEAPVLLAWWSGLLLGIRGLPLAVSRVNGWLPRYATVVIGGSVIQAALQVVLVAQGRGALGFVEGQLAGAIGSTLLALALASAVLGRPRLEPGTMAYTLAILPSGLASRLILVADRLVLAQFVPLDTLGTYGLAARLAMPVKMVGGIFRMALAPALSRAEIAGDLAAVFSQSTRLILAATLTMATGVALGSLLLQVSPWADVAAGVTGVLGLLLWAQVATTVQAMASLRIYYSGTPGASAWVSGAGAAMLLLGLWVLAQRWGGTGAAMAELLAAWVGIAAGVVALGRAAPEGWGAALALTSSFGLVASACLWLEPVPMAVIVSLALAAYGYTVAQAVQGLTLRGWMSSAR